jgi:hypothetical protein
LETTNLASCPPEILALDINAETLWRVLLKKVGVTISKGEHIEDKRAWILRNFGVPDLAHRLSIRKQIENGGPQDDVARAVIWRHVAEASSPGDSITDLSEQNRFLLNPFIVPKDKKFPNPMAALRKEMPFGDEKAVGRAENGVRTAKDRSTLPRQSRSGGFCGASSRRGTTATPRPGKSALIPIFLHGEPLRFHPEHTAPRLPNILYPPLDFLKRGEQRL